MENWTIIVLLPNQADGKQISEPCNQYPKQELE